MQTRFNDGRPEILEHLKDANEAAVKLKEKMADPGVESVKVMRYRPGQVVQMSDRKYVVDENGSLRRLD
jgi:hypothetical protein